MSLSYTITTDQFPNGTVVGVYDRSARVNDAAPSGSQITSATSSGTAVAFTGLPDAGGYFVAYAQVGGLPRYATFYVSQAPLLSSGSSSPAALTIGARDGAGNPTSVTEDGVTTTYTWNADGTPATETRNGITRTFTYSGGLLTGATV